MKTNPPRPSLKARAPATFDGSTPAPPRVFHEMRACRVLRNRGSPVPAREFRRQELAIQHRAVFEERRKMAALIETYNDLYELAPVGFVSVERSGRILQVNLTCVALLGRERGGVLQHPLHEFVAARSHAVLDEFLAEAFTGGRECVCEVLLVREDGSRFRGELQVAAVPRGQTPSNCWVVVSDGPLLMRASGLARANAELAKEVERRMTAETSLRRSQEELTRLLEEARETGEQTRLLTHRLVTAQEEDHRRISRELHDDIAQTLVGIQVHLQKLIAEAPASLRDLKALVVRTQELVGCSVERVLAFARGLRPAMLDDLGLVAALRKHIEEYAKDTRIAVTFEPRMPAGAAALGNAERTALFRVAQAALANAARHAQASRLDVRLWEENGSVVLDIRDNGIGFRTDGGAAADGRKRLGLLGMRERMALIGGVLHIRSSAGCGTTVRAEARTTPPVPGSGETDGGAR